MNSFSKIHRLPIYVAIGATIVVIPSLMDPINLPKLWVLCFGGGLCLAIFSPQITSLIHGGKKALLYVCVVFTAALSITSIVSPQGFFRTLVGVWGRNNGVLTYLALLLVFLSLASMRSNDSSRFLIQSLTFLGFLGALYGWLQSVGADLISWENPGNKIILTLGNSNFASAFLALTAIATLTLVLRTTSKPWLRIVLSTSFLVQMYLTMKSDALQGLLVLLIGSSILFGLMLTTSNRIVLKKFALIWWGAILTSGLIGINGLFGNGPLSTLLNPNLRSLQDRFYHWVAALNMIRENLLFGVGIDSFGDYYRGFRVLEAIQLRGTPTSSTNNAHNTFMQIGATGGLVLLSAYLALIVFTARRAIIAFKKNDDKILVSGIFSIWIAFQIQSLVSIDQIGLVVWGWAAAGCLVALSYVDLEPNKLKKAKLIAPIAKNSRTLMAKATSLLLIIFGFLPSIFLISTVRNEYLLREKIIELVSSNSEDALRFNAQKLYSEARKSDQPELRLLALQYLLQAKSNDLSLELASTTAKQFPRSFESWDALARIYEAMGEQEKAISARRVTLELDPFNDEIKALLEKDIPAK
jgi:O-antigen ligase